MSDARRKLQLQFPGHHSYFRKDPDTVSSKHRHFIVSTSCSRPHTATPKQTHIFSKIRKDHKNPPHWSGKRFVDIGLKSILSFYL